jgi:hypothetical protein
MTDITATATSTPITATASSLSTVSASVTASTVSASAGGGIGPQGPQGPAGPAGTGGGSSYTLPAASSSVLGGVKIGANVSAASDGTISVAAPTTSLAASAVTGLATVATSGAYADLSGRPTIPGAYSLPAATSTVLGGVKTGSNVTIAADGTISVAAPTTTLAATSITGLATVATTGAYADLSGLPTLGTAAAAATGDFAAASHTHALASLTQSAATTGQVPTWSGTAWAPATPTPATTSASSLTSGTLSDSLLSANVILAANFTANRSQSTSALDVFDRNTVTTTRPPNTGTVWFSFFSPAYSLSVSSITYASSGTAASGLTLARFGLYSWDGTTLTLLARTASDTTLFAAQQTLYQRSFDTTGGYPSSYALVAGTRYAVALIVVGTTVGTVMAVNSPTALSALAPRIQGVKASQSDLPATSTAFSGTTDAVPWARLS